MGVLQTGGLTLEARCGKAEIVTRVTEVGIRVVATQRVARTVLMTDATLAGHRIAVQPNAGGVAGATEEAIDCVGARGIERRLPGDGALNGGRSGVADAIGVVSEDALAGVGTYLYRGQAQIANPGNAGKAGCRSSRHIGHTVGEYKGRPARAEHQIVRASCRERV